GNQYALFSESRTLSEKSMAQYLDVAAAITKVKDPALHSDLSGTFQALVGLWQILVRQQGVPAGQTDQLFSGIVGGFAQIKNTRDLFDAGRNGVKLLLGSAASDPEPHQKLLEAVAGASSDSETHEAVLQELMRILEAQRTISLDTLFQL